MAHTAGDAVIQRDFWGTTMKLYRVMCEAEFESIFALNEFSTIPGTLEQKWFAENVPDALEWGRRFEAVSNVPHRRVVEIAVDRLLAEKMFRVAMLDGIGPARAAELELLRG